MKKPMFQKRHYEAIVEVLADTHIDNDIDGYSFAEIVNGLCWLFTEDNLLFDGVRFRSKLNTLIHQKSTDTVQSKA